MANIYKSNYTGSQIDEAIGEVINDKLQEKLIAGNNITISGNTISATVPTIPSITITNGTATTPTSDTVAVISGETASGHTITNTKVNVATQAYVDKKFDDTVVTIDTLNTFEAKLNENIIKDPSKTYLVWKGNQFPNSNYADFKAPAGCTIDWGDGNVETFETASTTVTTHTYTDGIEYHLISLSNYASIGMNAFYNCSGLTSVTIGNNVTSIGNYAFSDCSGLTNVTIGNGVTTIGNRAFQNCSNLKTIEVLQKTSPALGSNAFTSVEKIIVPKSSINAYKSAAGWSTYADKIVYEVDSSDLDKEHIAYVNKENTFTEPQTFSYVDSFDPNWSEYGEIGGSGANYSYTEYTDDTHKYSTSGEAYISSLVGRVMVGRSTIDEKGVSKNSIVLDVRKNWIARTETNAERVDGKLGTTVQTYYAYIFPKTYPNKEVTLATI